MIYKTLHWYILRELIRIFLLTASALSILLAFGGTLKPLTKQGIPVFQLMLVLLNGMAAMVAYAFPLAALFAAVLVYWRLSTDNEVTACRASGVSFLTILFPAFILGLGVASADLMCVNFVVPMFTQRMERIVRSDIGAILVSQISRQEAFEYNRMLVVYADGAISEVVSGADLSPEDRQRGVTSQTRATLHGMAAIEQGREKPNVVAAAKTAYVIIDELADRDEVQLRVITQDGAGYQFDTFNKVSGERATLPPNGEPLTIPSPTKNRPKFLNYLQLSALSHDPLLHPDLSSIMTDIKRVWTHQQIAQHIGAMFRAHPREPVVFHSADSDQVVVNAPDVGFDPEGNVVFRAIPGSTVRVDEYQDKKLVTYYKCDGVRVTLNEGDPGTGIGLQTRAVLEMAGNGERLDVNQGRRSPFTSQIIQPLQLPAGVPIAFDWDGPRNDILNHPEAYSPAIAGMVRDLKDGMTKLFQSITSEFHSRASFALSCLALVLLGAALGIIMRGKNPLLVFVIGFVPALVLILLIIAGRRMVEDASGGIAFGLGIVWAGNVLLLGLVAGVYAKLLRS